MNPRSICLVLALVSMAPASAWAQKRSKSRPAASTATATIATLKKQVAQLTSERNELKEKLAGTEQMPEELASAIKGRDLAREEAGRYQRELDQIKASLKENQQGGDALITQLKKAQEDLAACQGRVALLERDAEAARAKLPGAVAQEGALVPITPEITPARPLNLKRVTPSSGKADRGVVVVNVLVSEKGDVLETRLLQGLPVDSEHNRKAQEACLEAAKRLVFDPARTADGKVRVQVWQGVGFYLD